MNILDKVKWFFPLFYWNNVKRHLINYAWKSEWQTHPELMQDWLDRGHKPDDYHPGMLRVGKVTMRDVNWAWNHVKEHQEK